MLLKKLIFVLIVAGILCVPVLAYTEKGTHTFLPTGGNIITFANRFVVNNITEFSDTTYMVCQRHTWREWAWGLGLGSGTHNTRLTVSGSTVGNVTITYGASSDYRKNEYIEWIYTFNDFDPLAFTGERTINYVTQLPDGFYSNRSETASTEVWDGYERSAADAAKTEETCTIYSGSAVTTPAASFTCTPTSQYPGANYTVECTDSSTNTPTDWLWTIDWDNTGIDNYMTTNEQNASFSFAYSGIYSVNLRANNTAGSDWENKSAYLTISANATPNNCYLPVQAGYIRSVAQCLNSQDSSLVAGCDIQLRDNEGGSWSNGTDRADATWCIDTLPAHTVNAYAQATGYTGTARYNLPVRSDAIIALMLIPGYVPAAPEGKVYLYVTVNDADTLQGLAGAYVSAAQAGQPTKSDVAGSQGVVIITVKNSTSTYVTASKSGYTSVSRTLTTSAFGPDSLMISLQKSTIQPTATATPGPGGTVAPTISPGQQPTNPDGTPNKDYANQQGQIMMNFLASNGLNLVTLCVLVTMLALLGVKLGGR